MAHIAFGPSGWRGILCEDFTFDNIRVVVQAIADHVTANGERDKGLIVGYDTRFMGERFARDGSWLLFRKSGRNPYSGSTVELHLKMP